MTAQNLREFSLGLSPCPNDTFIFHALLHGLVSAAHPGGAKPAPILADVEKLNRAALEGELEITKISVGALPYVSEKYAVLNAGAALGWGCGPLLVARENLAPEDLADAVIAIPGKMTTANMLLDAVGVFAGSRKEMIFSDVMGAIENGEADAGVIIHEGRFTFERRGLKKILDLGQWWEEKRRLPLPLGVIVARRDLPRSFALAAQAAIAASLSHAFANPEASRDFVRANARELDDKVTAAHIAAFVTDFSLDLGEEGKNAIRQLMLAAGFRADNLFLEE